MKNRKLEHLTRRSFLASSLRATLFGAAAANGIAVAQQTPWRNWSAGLSFEPQGRYDVAMRTLRPRPITAALLRELAAAR